MIEIDLDTESISILMKKLAFTTENFPNTDKAFLKAAKKTQNIWSEYLKERKISPIKANLDAAKTGDFSSKVSTDSKEVTEIQEGKPPVDYDMKTTHPYGRKSRVSKKGVPYLIINFRWGTREERAHWTNYIPQHYIDTSVGLLDKMHITGLTHPEPNAKGQAIDRNEYENTNPKANKKWSSLSKEDAWEVTSKSGRKHTSQGLVHMDTGAYFTFRIISAKSPKNSWLYHRDGVPGEDMIGAIEKLARPDAERIVIEGLVKDIQKYNE